MDTTPQSAEVQLRLIVGELVVTIATLEAQKAALTARVAELEAVQTPEPGA